MGVVDLIAVILRTIVELVAIFAALLVIVSVLPAGNPLRAIVGALSMRVGATILAGMIAVPIEPIPGIDLLYDVGAPLFLLYYWATFFPAAARTLIGSSSRQESDSKSIVPHH